MSRSNYLKYMDTGMTGITDFLTFREVKALKILSCDSLPNGLVDRHAVAKIEALFRRTIYKYKLRLQCQFLYQVLSRFYDLHVFVRDDDMFWDSFSMENKFLLTPFFENLLVQKNYVLGGSAFFDTVGGQSLALDDARHWTHSRSIELRYIRSQVWLSVNESAGDRIHRAHLKAVTIMGHPPDEVALRPNLTLTLTRGSQWRRLAWTLAERGE